MASAGPAPDPKFSAVSSEWPTAEELAAAGRIRKANEQAIARLKDPARDVVGDLRVVRFLRARHHKEAEATEWYGEFLRQRLDESPEIETKLRPAVIGLAPQEFNSWFQERVHPSLPCCPWAGLTPDGAGLFCLRPGKLDAVAFTEERQDVPLQQDFLLMVACLEWILWYLDEESHKKRRMLYVVKVVDAGGLGAEGRKVPVFVPKMKEFMTRLLQSMQKPYCEHDAVFLVLNAPFVFRIVFNIISVLLTAKQKAKMRILGSTSDPAVLAKLYELVPAEMLPKELGGKREVLENVYPARGADAIPAWIKRVQSLDFWAPRRPEPSGPAAEAAGTTEPSPAAAAASEPPVEVPAVPPEAGQQAAQRAADEPQMDGAPAPAAASCC